MEESIQRDTVLVVDLDPKLTTNRIGPRFLAQRHFDLVKKIDHVKLPERGETLEQCLARVDKHLAFELLVGVVVALPSYFTAGRRELVEKTAQTWRDRTGLRVVVHVITHG